MVLKSDHLAGSVVSLAELRAIVDELWSSDSEAAQKAAEHIDSSLRELSRFAYGALDHEAQQRVMKKTFGSDNVR